MDFGALVGFDGCSVSPPDPDTNQKLYGSALCNTVINQDDDDCRRKRIDFKKMTKTTDDLSAIHRATSLIRSNGGHVSDSQQMLCFSSPNSLPSSLPYYHSAYARNTASGYGSSVHGIKGPFTPSQWMELEHQALIYKYITASAPVPSNLLIPIRKALESVVFSSFPGSHLRPNSLGWGGFHLGFSNTDPEPGRCRRTDGKKWRCSKDAVIDQKYCERHMNRGRHRSRKPVEGQTGQSSASRPPTTAAASKVVLPSSSTPPSVVTGSNSSNSLSINNLQRIAPPALSRGFMNNGNGLKQDRFSIPKQHDPYEQTSLSEFGLVSSNSLLNPLHKTYQDLNQETKSHHSLRQFMDDWPKNRSDKTELSISIPVPSSDFMSSTSSPRNEKHIPPSPLRLSRENFDPTQMETNPKKQENWVPISWENAMGGPLGEVLHSTNNSSSAGDYKGAALNLMTEGWDSCPSIASSPTGVLQKSTFRSLSNSSAGSSPIITSLAQI